MKSASVRRASVSLAALTAAVALICLAGVGPAQAGSCRVGYHWNALAAGAGFCAPNPSGGGTGGPGTVAGSDLGGGGTPKPAQDPPAPVCTPPRAPVYAPIPGHVSTKPAPTAKAKVGSVLKADKPGWAKGTTLKYRWLRNGVPIPGA